MRKVLVKHVFSLSVKGISVIVSFLLAKFYISKVSSEEFGLFTLNYGYIVLLATFIGTGPGLMIISKIRDHETISPFIFVLFNSLLISAGWFVVKLFFDFNNLILVAILISGVGYYLNESMRVNSSGNIYIIMKDIIRSVACIILLFLNFVDANKILVYSGLINLLFIFLFAFVTKRQLFLSFSKVDFSKKEYLASLSISSSSGMQIIKGWIEIYLSGIFLSLHEVGLFSVLQKLAKLISLPLNALNADIAKNLVVSIKDNAISKKLNQQILLTKITSILFALFCIVVLSYFLKLYGYENNTINIIVGIALILTNLSNALFGPVGLFSQLGNLRNYFLWSTIFSVLVSIILSYILLPLFGIIALAIINLLTMIAWNWILYYKIKKETGIKL